LIAKAHLSGCGKKTKPIHKPKPTSDLNNFKRSKQLPNMIKCLFLYLEKRQSFLPSGCVQDKITTHSSC